MRPVSSYHTIFPAFHSDDTQIAADAEFLVVHPGQLAGSHAVAQGYRVQSHKGREPGSRIVPSTRVPVIGLGLSKTTISISVSATSCIT